LPLFRPPHQLDRSVISLITRLAENGGCQEEMHILIIGVS